MKFFLFNLLLIILVGTLLQAQTDSIVNHSFEDKVQAWMAEYNVPAVGIGIIEDSKIKYLKVFGELQKGIPTPDNAIFDIASITKPVVAMLTLKLVETGQWKLDESLFHYWIDPDVENDPLHKKLTTRHVLSHQTGFPNWRKGKLAFEFEPGTDFLYSGEGFVYLANALERKFKKSWGQLSDSLLFKPIGMKDTWYCWDKNIDESRFAFGHDSKGNMHPQSKIKGAEASAAGGLLTTIEDYCKFSIYVIHGAGLSPAIYNDMVSPHAKIKDHCAKGLGWEIISDLPGGEYALEHGGNNEGFRSRVVLLPKSKRGVIVFTNGDNGLSVCNNVIKESIDIAKDIFDYMKGATRKIIALEDEILERYTGAYLIDSYGVNLSISKGDGVLIMSSNRFPTATLYPEAENKFFIKDVDIQIEYSNDGSMTLFENGKIDWTAKKIK
jgi:CubicO group peptidase (beta-lactamase class C family)